MLADTIETELDSGPRGGEAERFCVATRTVKPVDEMIRFVVGPDGQVVPDLKRKLPGRGVWVDATRAALAEATRRKAFARGFKREVRVAADFVDSTERLLVRSVLDALAIAGKAGQVVAGFAKVEGALARDNVAAVIHAADAAPDGVRKIDAALRRRFGDDVEKIAIIDAFGSQQLDLALGRANVVHAALLAGPASDTLIERSMRLRRFRAGSDGRHRDSKQGLRIVNG
jgi:predicted RNA-binding protein YlxR (DUF448 family)